MLFVRDDADGTTDVYAATIDGRAERRIVDTVAPHTFSEDPSWSPDGKHVAIWTEGDNDTSQVIEVLATATGKIEATVRTADYLAPVNPRWSPDGHYLAVGVERYVAEDGDVRRDGGAIGLVDLWAAAPSIRLLAPYSLQASYPAWSPGGDRIMFTAGNLDPYFSPGDGPNNLFTVRPDGSGLLQLTHMTGRDPVIAAPDWGSGTRPVVVSLVHSPQSFHLATLDADGSNLTEIVDPATGLPVEGAHPRHVAVTH
jgi:Tol biopolymer transport system component